MWAREGVCVSVCLGERGSVRVWVREGVCVLVREGVCVFG